MSRIATGRAALWPSGRNHSLAANTSGDRVASRTGVRDRYLVDRDTLPGQGAGAYSRRHRVGPERHRTVRARGCRSPEDARKEGPQRPIKRRSPRRLRAASAAMPRVIPAHPRAARRPTPTGCSRASGRTRRERSGDRATHRPLWRRWHRPVREVSMTQQRSREDVIQQDVADLHKLGYAQELLRSMGGFSNFAISFSIISILTGAVILYDYGLAWAGTAAVMIGWPFDHGLRADDRRVDVRDRVRVSDGRWPVLLGQPDEEQELGMVDRLVQSHRPVRDRRRHQLRGGLVHQRHDRDADPVQLRDRLRQHDRHHRVGRAADPRRLAGDDGHPHAHPAGHQHRRHQPRRAAEPGQRLVAHRRSSRPWSSSSSWRASRTSPG